jgi:hypothetical protein
MLFKKLFQLLVIGGAAVGAGSGCGARAQTPPPDRSKAAARDGGAVADDREGGTGADAGTAKASESGGGVQGW